MKEYLSRIADAVLVDHLESKGAVLVQGPKWCGKTTTAKHIAASILEMDHPDLTGQYQELARIKPSSLLEGAVPRLIDEWQIAPNLWNTVRHEVDKRDEFGQFILTGSAVPPKLDEKTTHTGTGRIVRMTMRPMSLYESGDSNGEVSLEGLFRQEEPAGSDSHDIDAIAFLICRGGWPKAIGQKPKVALKQASDYVSAVTSDDISRVDGVRREPVRTERLLRSYARNIAGQVPLTTIKDDLSVNEADSFNIETVAQYIHALERIFVIEDAPAWNPNLRSKTAIRTSDTRYFVDPSIAAASLGIGPDDLVANLNTMGFLFENLCIRDLRIYAERMGGKVYHFRDKAGLECDAVIHLRNGEYGLVEVKLGGDKLIAEGAASLLKLAGKIDTDRMKKPAFMMVLCGVAPYAYKRKDGVIIVPVSCLKD